MKTRTLMPLVAAACLAVSVAAPIAVPVAARAQAPSTKPALHDAMRKLWTDHVAWTRLFIVSAVGGLPDLAPTTDRLLKNQDDIGAAVGEYYGEDAGHKLTALLKTHINTAGEVVMAAKAGDHTKLADAKKRWYANADEIAAFLHAANPNHWPLATMKTAMRTHLDQTLDEATHRIQAKYNDDIGDYGRIVTHILVMADMLSDGIAAQFPQKLASGN